MSDDGMDIEAPERPVTIYGQGGVQTEIDLNQLDNPEIADVIPDLLTDYAAECKDWTLFAVEHWKQGRWDRVEDLIGKAIAYFSGGLNTGRPPDYLALARLHSMLAHFHLGRARTAPRVLLPHAKHDKLNPSLKLKEYHYTEAAANLNRADGAHKQGGGLLEDEPITLSLGKIILNLARGNPAAAQPLVDHLLQRQPKNVVALFAQARLLFAKRSHDKALEIYQRLLGLNPDMQPDPRIGLGLCLWVLGDKDRAKIAWERAQKRDQQAWIPLLLLGLASLNLARDPSLSSSDRLKAEASGVQNVQKAFKINPQSSAATLALASISGQAGRLIQASKLAERAIQYSDNKRHTILANAERGRLGFITGDIGDAGPFIAAAKGEDAGGINIMAELTLGQIAIKSGNLREALNYIEQTAKRLAGTGPLEYTVLHACLLNYPHPGMSADELNKNRHTARTMLTDLHEKVSAAKTDEEFARLRGIGQDSDIFLELAKMWMNESLDKATSIYQTAVKMNSPLNTQSENTGNLENGEEESKEIDIKSIKMGSNLGVLYHLQGSLNDAEMRYQDALQKVAGREGDESEMMRTVLAFNLGRAYEEEGDVGKAQQWFRDVLRQHPEHMESKVRLAAIASSQGRNVDAHNLLKECLRSDETSIPLRSTYTHFLISIGSIKEALLFTSNTLKYDKSDIYTFCALGHIHYHLAREAKTQAELADRTKQYLRSAEAYERALMLDNGKSAMAAQGLAIALAEDSLTLPTQKAQIGQPGSTEELKYRMKLAGQALGILGRINDSLPDGNTCVNIGHCYFTRGEEEKAIQFYEAAENHFKGRNVSNLLYLSRTWYAWANRDVNISAMNKALSYAQKAMHIQPFDRAILYNIAMIQQKSAEMVFGLEPSRRTLEELKTSLEQAQQAANTFRALADDNTSALPYDRELADQRARYGDGLIRKAPEQVQRQEAYEGEAAARVEQVKKLRAEEQEKILAAENARKAEIEKRAAELAEQRRIAQEEAKAYHEQIAKEEAEELSARQQRSEALKEKKRRKDNGEIIDGDSGAKRRKTGGGKKRKGRKGSEILSESEVSEMSGRSGSGAGGTGGRSGSEVSRGPGEEVDMETVRAGTLEKLRADRKKKQKKRKVEDPDDEPSARNAAKDKGKFKSKAYIEDSDEEAEEYDQAQAQTGGPEVEGNDDEETEKIQDEDEGIGAGDDESNVNDEDGEVNGGGGGLGDEGEVAGIRSETATIAGTSGPNTGAPSPAEGMEEDE